jgi:agmatinase
MTGLPGFLADDLPPCEPAGAQFHLVPVPLEASVSYGGGTADGPRAILAASAQLEVFDGHGEPGRAGVHVQAAVACAGRPVAAVLAEVGTRTTAARSHGAIPLLLGGEHTITLGAVRALREAGLDFGLVQLDAHADLRDRYHDDPLSHACVMRRCHELGVPLAQFAVRALSREEHDYREVHRIHHFDAEALHHDGLPARPLGPDFPTQIHLTLDLDALDPSLMPATGTPVPGGLSWWDCCDLLDRLLAGRRLIGADLVELAPHPAHPHCEFTAAALAYRVMGSALRSGD